MRRSVSKKATSTILALGLGLLCQTGCQSGSVKGKLPPIPSSKLNPYRGQIKDILPSQVGEYKLVNTQSLKETGVEMENPVDGAGGIYNTPSNHTVQHLLVNFPSAADANKELDNDLTRYGQGRVKPILEDLKDAAGQKIGRKITVRDGNTEALSWTNGSLYCSVVSYTGYSSEFAGNLPY
jgi:hypothetical protein